MKEIIHGNVPSKSNCYKIISLGKGMYRHSSLARTPALKKYERDFFMQLSASNRGKCIEGLFELHIDVYYPSMRSDLDNSLKVVLDCLQSAKAIKNDNKCVKIIANKHIDKTKPRIEFNLIDLEC